MSLRRAVLYMKTVIEQLIADIRERDRAGNIKYGGLMLAGNKTTLDWLKEAYEEQLDNAAYLKAAIIRLESE